MKWVLMLTCMAGSCWPQSLCARNPHVELRKASLICGGTQFFVRGKFIRSVSVSVPVSQAMMARTGSTRRAVPVDLRQTKVSYPLELGAAKGLASFVSGWQCRKTPAGHVLVLWVICSQDLLDEIPAALCSSTGEWERYIGLDGSLLDRGFSFEDIRYDTLRAKLGYHDKPDQAGDEGQFISIH